MEDFTQKENPDSRENSCFRYRDIYFFYITLLQPISLKDTLSELKRSNTHTYTPHLPVPASLLHYTPAA